MGEYMLFFKGILIGIGKILPGVSGCVIAVLLNEYNSIIEKINDIKNNYKYLLTISLGIIVGIVLFSNIIVYMLKFHYLKTMLFFIGLMLGGITSLFKKSNFKLSYLIISIMVLTIINYCIKYVNINPDLFITKIILGSIESISTLIPGISGSAIFMILNVYELIMYRISSIFNFNLINETIHFFIPYVLGILITSIVIIKVLNKLIKNNKIVFNSLVIGFSIYSTILLLINTFNKNYLLIDILISLLLFITGYLLSKVLKY